MAGPATTDDNRRLRTLTEQGEERYAALKKEHLSKQELAHGKICAEIAKIQSSREDQEVLQAIDTAIKDLASNYKTIAKNGEDFFERTNTVQSRADGAAFVIKTAQITLEIHQALSELEDILPERSPSVHSRSSRTSGTSTASRAWAKVEAAKTRLLYAKKQAEIKKQQMALEAELSLLEHEKELAATKAEAEALDQSQHSSATSRRSSASVHRTPHSPTNLPKESSVRRTAAYVEQHSAPHSETDSHKKSGLNPQTLAFDWTSVLLKKELLLNRLSTFKDTPETYISWRETFRSAVVQLSLSPAEQVDLLIKHLGPESGRQATSTKAANPRNPEKALERIWDRLDERYGAPEMVMAALQQRLAAFPKISANSKDAPKLYELSDLLAEIEGLKEDPAYTISLAYFDSTAGVNMIVGKLPYGIQEKWTSHAVRYCERYGSHYPPFTEFSSFLRQQSKIRNNPCFKYDGGPANTTKPASREQNIALRKSTKDDNHVTARKTDLDDATHNTGGVDASTTGGKGIDPSRCPIHGTKHTLAVCKAFRTKPIGERLHILKKHRGCYKCAGLGHMRDTCQTPVKCESCGDDRHSTAMHVDGEERQAKDTPNSNDTTPQEHANSKCTQVCGSDLLTSKSCAKILPVQVYQEGSPSRAVKTYAIIDDQSNRSLAKTELLNLLDVQGKEIEYTLTSCNGRVRTSGRKASGLVIESADGSVQHNLPPLIECDDIPSTRDEIPSPAVARHHAHLRDIECHITPVEQGVDILLLIGRDLIEAHHVLDQRIGPNSAPYAQRLSLGWVVIGETCLGGTHRPDHDVIVNKTTILQNGRPTVMEPCPNGFEAKEHGTPQPMTEFQNQSDIFMRTKNDDEPGLSIEDREFLEVMDQGFHKDRHGNWVAPLPFHKGRTRLPNNRPQAVKRARTLTASLQKDPRKREHFITFMKQILDSGHAEVAPPLRPDEECWYLPIFGVYHPKKTNKIRGVFDSSAKFEGVSLNDVLMSGPDMTNNMLGILLRFRREAVGVMADIERMFYQFKVQECHQNFLRFLWYTDNDPTKDLIEYRMRVHVFGNSSSPAVATYGLRKTAQSEEGTLGRDMRQFVDENFYVDDGIASLATSQEATDLLMRTQTALLKGGNLRLHKIVSNSNQVMEAFPKDDLGTDLKDQQLGGNIQRTLGVSWNTETDSFTFSLTDDDKPDTRRGVLSTVNGLYDPMGFLAPVTIEGKLQLRDLVSATTDWDDPMPEEMQAKWQGWKQSLTSLHNLQIPRRFSSCAQAVQGRELHIFADASEKAIAAVAYMKTVHVDGEEINIVLGKAKVAPKNAVTMPRLELCAAVLASEVGNFVQESLHLDFECTAYYSDSKVVLGYITNRTRRFYTFVANRVQQILGKTRPTQWKYIPTHLNPADQGTRGVPADLLASSSWLLGPDFLRSGLQTGVTPAGDCILTEDDVEVRPEVGALKTNTGSRGSPAGTL